MKITLSSVIEHEKVHIFERFLLTFTINMKLIVYIRKHVFFIIYENCIDMSEEIYEILSC